MRTVYCNDQSLSDRLLVAKTDEPYSADVLLLRFNPKMLADELLDTFKLACDKGKKCLVFPDGDVDFYNKVRNLVSVTPAEVVADFGEIEDKLKYDIEIYSQYSVEDFVVLTAKKRGIDPNSVLYLVHVVERNLKSHSVYPIVMTVVGMYEAGETNFTKFGERMQYFLDVFKRAKNSEDIFQQTKSQCLAVLAADGKAFINDWEKYEKFTMSVLLRPYGVNDTLEERVNMVVRTIKQAR
ncbi:MAG: hypothetical protein NC131_20430 [Roseburia sp.]|nr:hypothetical protein [Roseburia sp.]